jgi:hypothetical protein
LARWGIPSVAGRTGSKPMDADLLYSTWPLLLCLGWATFVFSFLIPEPVAVTILRLTAFALLVLAAIFTVPGIA